MFTPDNSFKCINCGKEIKGAAEPMDLQRAPIRKQSLNLSHLLLIAVVVGVAVLAYFMLQEGSKGGTGYAANTGQSGQEINIANLVYAGKTTIFDFYSDYCPPCRKISPLLKQLDDKREDIVVVKIDINREGVRGIDWSSPVVRQYGIRPIPHFMIYDASGNLTHEGRTAYQQIFQLFAQEGIRFQ
jgi:thiol-disulfide isomerase/thioredoxin